MNSARKISGQLRRGKYVVLLAALGGCSTDQQRSELSRQVSPNQKIVAVLMETLTGGTAASAYEDIYLGDQGAPLNFDKSVFSGMGCTGLSFAWRNDYTLEIHYPTTCTIRHFTNRWFRPIDLQVGRPNPFEIILVRE